MLSSTEMVMRPGGAMKPLEEFIKDASGGGGVGAWSVIAGASTNQEFAADYNFPDEIESAFSAAKSPYTDIIIVIEDYRAENVSRKLCFTFSDTFEHFKSMFNVDSAGFAYAGNEIGASGNCTALWVLSRGKADGHHKYQILVSDTTVKTYDIKVKFMVR